MRLFAFGSVILGGVLLAGAARAEEMEPPPKPRPTAPDTRSGRPTIALQLGLGRLFGSAEAGFSQTSSASWGAVPGVQLAFPVSRSFAIEAWGSYGSYTGGTLDYPQTKASSISGGLGGVYHLVDGIPFDPWFSAGIGVRKTHFELYPGAKVDYLGIVVPRFVIGMDYYVAPYLGMGPFLDISLMRNFSKSPGTIDQLDMGSSFTFGARVVFSPFQ